MNLALVGTNGRVTSIAEALDVERHTIAADIQWLEALWMAQLVGDPVAIKARELAELDDMEREAADRYGGYFVMDKGTKDREPVPILISGDGRWWDRRLATKKRRAEMLGLDSPAKQDLAVRGPFIFTIGKGYEDPD